MSPYGRAEFERRAFPRFKLELPIYFERHLRPGPETAGRTLDISVGGLQVCLPDRVAAGDRLRIQLRLTDPKAPRLIEAVVVVAWAAPSGPREFKAGLKFEEISAEDVNFLQRFKGLWLEE